MATPFSSTDDAIINTIVPLSDLTISSSSKASGVDVEKLYDIRWIAAQLRKYNFRRIALQFPDELLCDASKVYWALEDTLKQDRAEGGDEAAPKIYVLADTSYGNCCVDEVAAEHVDADVVVHFGHACLSLTSRLPALYVFHRLPVDVKRCCDAFVEALGQQHEEKVLLLMYDVGYDHAAEDIYEGLQTRLGRPVRLCRMEKGVNWTRFVDRNDAAANEEATVSEYESRKTQWPEDLAKSDSSTVLYIGPESLALTNLLLKLGPGADVMRYDATDDEVKSETGRTNKLLQRRYFAVQKARDAQTVGLLVGTLGLRSYLPLLQHLRDHLKRVQGKRVYTISVGKLNPAKLANFQEIDVFVLVACPENSLVDSAAGLGAHDSRDFFRPIVTPFELLTAFKGRQWTGEYVLNLGQVYEEVQQLGTGDDGEQDSDTPHFSLVTGGLISSRRNVASSDGTTGETGKELVQLEHSQPGVVTVRSADGTLTRVMESAGAAHLATRSWRGLNQRIGMDEPAPLETGRVGRAQAYVAGDDGAKEGS
jgi:diphthamide biosynthesis protein 2